jgi:hypothetical protein
MYWDQCVLAVFVLNVVLYAALSLDLVDGGYQKNKLAFKVLVFVSWATMSGSVFFFEGTLFLKLCIVGIVTFGHIFASRSVGFCKKCGRLLDLSVIERNKFCPKCGGAFLLEEVSNES